MLLMRQPLPIGSVLGNRTPDSAVRGLRLNLLTNTPYSLFIYAVQRKINYTEELPSCPVLFLFFSKLFWGPDGYGGVGRPEFVYENRIQWVFGQAYANRHRGAGQVWGCRSAGVCVRKPNSVGFRAGVRKPAPGHRPVTGVSAGRSLRTKTEFSGFSGRRTQTGTGAPTGYGGVGRPEFAPSFPRSLMPSFRGANSSPNSQPKSAVSPAAGPADLLPAPR